LIEKQYKEILENNLSRKAVDLIIADTGQDTEKFRILISFILKGTETLSSRAAWAIEGIDSRYPGLINPYLPSLIKALPGFKHPGSSRNILKILTRKNIPEIFHGTLTDQCFQWLMAKTTPVAIQVYSMQIIANLAEYYPELMHELGEVLESLMDTSLPGFRSRAKKILKKKLQT